MIKAVGYVRCSTDKQDVSLEQQREKLQQFAQSKGWELVEVFTDDAITGSDLNRPGLRSLLSFTETAKDVKAVIAWDRNRLARPKDPIDGMMLERQFMENGKQIFYASTGQETDKTFASGLISYVEHYQNGDYLRKLSRDTMRGMINCVKRGFWPSGGPPHGYDRLVLDQAGNPKKIVRDMSDRSQVIFHSESGQVLETLPPGVRFHKQKHEQCTLIPSEPVRVKVIQKIFNDYAAGVPIRRIRIELMNAGIRTAKGNVFSHSAIHSILENPAYTGKNAYNRRTRSKWHTHTNGQSVERQGEGEEKRPESDWIVMDNAWPALIDRDLFEQVQARREASRQAHIKMTGNKVHSRYLLSGRFRCGICGGAMFGMSRKNQNARYYSCTNHHQGAIDKCPQRYTVPAIFVENHILDIIKQDLLKLQGDKKLHEYITAEIQRLTGTKKDSTRLLHKRLAEIDQETAHLRDHLKTVSPNVAQSLGLYVEAEELTQEREKIETELKEIQRLLPAIPKEKEIRVFADNALNHFGEIFESGTIEEKREIIGLYVDKIIAYPESKTIKIALYPPLFNAINSGSGRFTPCTRGYCY